MAEPQRKPAPGGAAGKQGAAPVIKLTKQQQQNLAVIAIVVAGALYVYVKILMMPAMSQYKEKAAILEVKSKELQDARTMVAKYPEFLKRASEISSRTEFINRRLPQDSNVSETIREITKRATESNINIIKFEPGKETVKGEYKEMEIRVTFLATFRDLGDFLTRLGYIERLTTSSNLLIKGLTDADARNLGRIGSENLSIEMSIKIYSFV
jgi:Tfp pilus assembly protein PilO